MTTRGRLTVSPNRWEWLLDAAALVACIVAAAAVITDSSWAASPAVVVAASAVALRRRFPVWSAVAAVVVSGLVLFDPAVAVPVWVLAEVVLFTLAIRASRGWTFALATAHAVLLYVGAVAVFGERPWEPVALILPVWTAAVVATGLALRSNHDYVRALEHEAQSALAFRESEVARHVGEERLRIARDLHDSVAHTVSVIAVHAGSAERQLDRDPQRARESLAQVRASSREVVEELQDILVLLRAPDAPGEIDDVPGTASLDALIATARTSGMDVVESIDALPHLDRSVGMAVYRILQESLTNARKYGAGPVEVVVRAEDAGILLEVVSAVAPTIAHGPGFGIIGMRERAASVHGALDAGERDGRFVVRARLPLHLHSHESEER